ncbi:MAG TPA: glutamate 5-kinase [Wenzhouxiangella sp.]|nr:glutamate 5-kinase [Wenzhouxiangella sp.]
MPPPHDPTTSSDTKAADLLREEGLFVVKIGSSLLVDEQSELRLTWLKNLAQRFSELPGKIVLVSSGAIACGRSALRLAQRPRSLAEAQAAAAIGQISLAGAWAEAWKSQGRVAAQVLLTLGDLEQRRRYLNARATLETLIEHGVVPVVNENDTVATEEIRFGDNDRLAARVAQLVGAGTLVLLSDVDGLYTGDPAHDPKARHIPVIDALTPDVEAMAGELAATGLGTGGMKSKLAAARIATDAGVKVVLASGRGDDPIGALLDGAAATVFSAGARPLVARKRWLRGLQNPLGQLMLDDGALRALKNGASLLAVGVRTVRGDFQRGDLVSLVGPEGLCGQGLCAYDAGEAMGITGLSSERIAEALDAGGRGPMVHRDDLVLF